MTENRLSKVNSRDLPQNDDKNFFNAFWFQCINGETKYLLIVRLFQLIYPSPYKKQGYQSKHPERAIDKDMEPGNAADWSRNKCQGNNADAAKNAPIDHPFIAHRVAVGPNEQ